MLAFLTLGVGLSFICMKHGIGIQKESKFGFTF